MLRFSLFLAVILAYQAPLLAQSPLFIPDTLSGTQFELNLDENTYEFTNGITANNTMGVNGPILAPTLIFQKHDSVFITLNNDLNEATTMHWHGMHVSPENDGGPHSIIPAGTTWRPAFEVLDNATTFWYHPHLHETTNEHVTRGIAGAIIVRDEEEAALELPRTYGVDDFPLIVQDRSFMPNGNIAVVGFGDEVMVNATFEAFLEVPAQVVRFRIINGSSERVYLFGLSDNRTFYQIGSDGGLLESPVALNRLQLATGERAEILINFSADEGETLSLMSYASDLAVDIPGGPGGGAPSPLDGVDFEVMEFRIQETNDNPVTTIPNDLVTITRYDEADVDRTRIKTFEGGGPGNPFTIGDQIFDMSVINDTVYLDDTEIWEITNNTNIAHPFHIHDVQFFILDRDGVEPPENERGLKDVVLIRADETVRFITKFEDFYDNEIPYMYHCHILTHEDDGMMGQFLVLENPNITSNETETDINVPSTTKIIGSYPNPFNPVTNIRYHIEKPSEVELIVYNMRGQIIETLYQGSQNRGNYVVSWDASGFASGVYFVRLNTGSTMSTIRVLLVK
ncbi:MAG: T9SS C-terminal target domain-containing protein [Balneola sp.]|nr:MAG: T9SS C-terminal target domain-containing protein [Balneola sp.]